MKFFKTVFAALLLIGSLSVGILSGYAAANMLADSEKRQALTP